MSEIKRYVKKSIPIEAVQWNGLSSTANAFIGEAFGIDWWYADTVTEESDGNLRIVIPTLDGNHVCNIGDWIIRGVKGELYLCKPDIFEQTY